MLKGRSCGDMRARQGNGAKVKDEAITRLGSCPSILDDVDALAAGQRT